MDFFSFWGVVKDIVLVGQQNAGKRYYGILELVEVSGKVRVLPGDPYIRLLVETLERNSSVGYSQRPKP